MYASTPKHVKMLDRHLATEAWQSLRLLVSREVGRTVELVMIVISVVRSIREC